MSDQDRHEYEVERELYEHAEEEQYWLEHENMIETGNGEDNEH
jgi:hypothetical protein